MLIQREKQGLNSEPKGPKPATLTAKQAPGLVLVIGSIYFPSKLAEKTVVHILFKPSESKWECHTSDETLWAIQCTCST